MQRFRRILLPMQGHSKSNLHWLYNERHSNDPNFEEGEKIFSYGPLRFWFCGTGHRSSEKLLMHIQIPLALIGNEEMGNSLPYETFLLRLLAPIISELSKTYLNTDKNIREKAQFMTQNANECMIRRSGIYFDRDKNTFILQVHFNVPLVNALSVNAKAAIRAVRNILGSIKDALDGFERRELDRYVKTYDYQQQIRTFMKKHDLCAFVANGSILPRENGTSQPMECAVAFVAPPEMEVTIPFSDGTKITGMGIKKGVTVITGGGYSGKSTLLDAIEMGIYDHIPGDGREFVLTDDSALKIYAEDGRPVSSLDMSPFFRYLPGNVDLSAFSTPHASGSVSQAANIIEAVCGGSRLLLIDEDKSATNFMIRDKNMRRIVPNEPIIPFTDRVEELYSVEGVSTILVIGGSSEYLAYADHIILMEDYLPKLVNEEIQDLQLNVSIPNENPAMWMKSRKLIPKETAQAFLYFLNVETENEKKIILDEYSADITLLTALVSGEQLNTLACVMKGLLTDKEAGADELLVKIDEYLQRIFGKEGTGTALLQAEQRFYESVRVIDVFCCVERMRGVRFNENDQK